MATAVEQAALSAVDSEAVVALLREPGQAHGVHSRGALWPVETGGVLAVPALRAWGAGS